MPAWYVPTRAPRTLTVIGGSSPFTLSMVAAFLEAPPWPEGELVLQGRDAAMLEDVARCGDRVLDRVGWRVRAVPDLTDALAEADVVLHQNRYGGLAWRERDEQLATDLGLGPDETIGPAGLSVSLRTVHGQRPYAAAFARLSPQVPVLTMTNPLAVSTAHFADAGARVLGLCELPEMTRLDLAAAAGVDPGQLRGSYTGLNHRGFWHHVTFQGRDVLPGLARQLKDNGTDAHGVTGAEIEQLQAFADKYHELFRSGVFLTPGRSASLASLRSQIRVEASADPTRLPPSLGGRDMPWHRIIVLPVLRALAGDRCEVVVTRAEDGIGVERQVALHGADLELVPGEGAPAAVREWFEGFRVAEKATLAAATDPTPESVRAALAADRYVPEHLVDRAATAVLAAFEEWRESEG